MKQELTSPKHFIKKNMDEVTRCALFMTCEYFSYPLLLNIIK